MKKLFSILLLCLSLFSCSEFQKAYKTEDPVIKYDLATKLFETGKYSKAIRLFEQLAPTYRGKPQSEKMFYMYAMSFYKSKQYYVAAGRFESFVASYPKSEKAEEAVFLDALSTSKLSPIYSLDQVETVKGIDKMQNFINTYPISTNLPEANETVKRLREKLEKKAFEIAFQYNKISDHKAALVSLDNFLIDYPGTPFKEKALYYRFDSAYIVAENSYTNLMEERLKDARICYNNLIKFNPNTTYKAKADKMLEQIEKDLKQFSK